MTYQGAFGASLAARAVTQQAETVWREHWQAVGRARAFRRRLAAREAESSPGGYAVGRDTSSDDWPEWRG